MKQEVRILGGKHRGKKITFPDEKNLRPTPARVRETVFNWLMHSIQHAHCLDAFAGSGTLGFEAFSRGAASVTLLESSRTTYLHLRKQAEAFHTKQLTILHTQAEQFLSQAHTPFDLIFLDPPFEHPQLLTQCIELIENHQVLTQGGFIYTESSKPVELDDSTWHTYREKKAGQVIYALHQKRD